MLRIAVAGSPLSTPKPGGSLMGVRQCARLGIQAMEVEFVQGVRMKDELAAQVGVEAKKLGISLSVHGPYFINLCSDEAPKLKNSHRHLLESARAGRALGAGPVVFHPGFYQGRTREECAKRAKKELSEILEAMEANGWGSVRLGPELTGKKSAYGDLEEILELARHFGLAHVQPVIDFGHYHARIGRIRGKADYEAILDRCEAVLGGEYRKGFHSHYSEIQYSDAGEGKHLPIGSLKAGEVAPESGKGAGGPPFLPLLEALHERGYAGTVVCESPAMEKDVLVMEKRNRQIGKG